MKTRSLLLALVAIALSPDTVRAAADFTLYVANYLAYDPSPTTRYCWIEEFDSLGRASSFVSNTSFATPVLYGPTGIAIDASNNVYVTCQQDGDWIEKFDPWGNNGFPFVSATVSDPNALAFDAAGNLYVAGGASHIIEGYSPSGAAGQFAEIASADLVGLAFDINSNLYVSDEAGGVIYKFDLHTNLTKFAAPGYNPYALAFDSSGSLYVALRGNGQILRYKASSPGVLDPSSTVFTSLGAITQPVGLAFDPDGYLYASEYSTNQIVKIDSSGKVSSFATAGLNGPAFIALQPKPVTMYRYVVAGGGGTSSGGEWSITGAAGQLHTGTMMGQVMQTGEWLAVQGGFFAGTVVSFPQSTNLLLNGSFSFGSFTNEKSGDNAMPLAPGSTNMLGWIVTGTFDAQVGWGTVPTDLGLSPPAGVGYYLDLTGYTDTPPYAGVTQTVPTVAGQTYDVSFEIGYSAQYDSGGWPAVTVAVSRGIGIAPMTNNFVVTGTVPWQPFTFSFTAAQDSTTLTFTGSTPQSVKYIGLANVIMWASTASSGSGIVMSVPSISSGQLQLPFSLGAAAAGTTYELQQASQVTGPWTAAQGVTMTMSPDGTMGTFLIHIESDTVFYRVRSY